MIMVYRQVSMQIIGMEEHHSLAILENSLEMGKEWMALNNEKWMTLKLKQYFLVIWYNWRSAKQHVLELAQVI